MAVLNLLWMTVLTAYYIVRSWMLWIIPPRKKSVADETVLITGAGSGIGRLMAVEFAKRGALVVLWDINKSGNEATARLVREMGGRAHTYVCDISKKEDVYEAAAKVKEEVGEVTILINNAGIVSGTKLLDTPDAKIIKTMEVNTLAHVWMLKSFLPDMFKNDRGHVVTISSLAGHLTQPGMADYCMSKFAAVGLHESVEKEAVVVGAENVNFTIVNPYLINTGMFKGVTLKYPGLLPALEPEYVVEKIMHAVLTNQRVIFIPRLLYLLKWMKSWIPVEAALLDKDVTNMDPFIGHADKDITNMDPYTGHADKDI
ncbi:epidermal retinol dehydrogenase 2-like [Amphiura filiformis]|uniref:epidermal retinol dehydrogenase 2-like n=1 Tax=Amphiura filiformis TaxID=82378 RepID=UPI003B227B26